MFPPCTTTMFLCNSFALKYCKYSGVSFLRFESASFSKRYCRLSALCFMLATYIWSAMASISNLLFALSFCCSTFILDTSSSFSASFTFLCQSVSAFFKIVRRSCSRMRTLPIWCETLEYFSIMLSGTTGLVTLMEIKSMPGAHAYKNPCICFKSFSSRSSNSVM